MQASRDKNLSRWQMTALLAIAYAARVFTLTGQSLWRDEVDALRFATAPWAELLKTFTQPGWNGPLYFALLRGWIELTGKSEFALRYFSLLFGVIAGAIAFVLAKRLAGSSTALVCTLLFVASPYLIWYSQEAKMYTLILAMATLAVYALRRAVESNRAGWWLTLVVATSVAFYSHILAALLIPIELVLALAWGIGSRNSQWRIGALISFSCLTLPYLPLVRWQLPLIFSPAQTGYTFYPLDQMLVVMLNGFATGVSGLVPQAVLWPIGALLLVGMALAPLQWRDRAALMAWLLLPPLALYLVSLNRPIFTDRYLIWIGPAFYLLVALGVIVLWRLWKPLGVAGALAVIGIAGAGVYFQAVTPIKSDLRGAAHYFQAHHSPDDLVIFQIPYIRYTFDYYYHEPYDWAEGLFTNYGMSDADVDKQMRALVAGRKNVWLVASEMEMWDSHLQVRGWLESHGRKTDQVTFAQVMLYRYDF